jgi:hypothetical protein
MGENNFKETEKKYVVNSPLGCIYPAEMKRREQTFPPWLEKFYGNFGYGGMDGQRETEPWGTEKTQHSSYASGGEIFMKNTSAGEGILSAKREQKV